MVIKVYKIVRKMYSIVYHKQIFSKCFDIYIFYIMTVSDMCLNCHGMPAA